MASYDYSGKVVVISGASSGIGLELAKRFYEAGAYLALCSRSKERVDNAISEFCDPSDPRILSMSADMSQLENVYKFTSAAIEKFGKIDILINNAGVSFKKPSLEVTEKDWDTTYNIDMKAYFFMAQQAAKDMIEKGTKGSIINIGSVNAVTCVVGNAIYAAAKAGIAQMTRTLGREWGKEGGIRINCIAPGSIDTPENRELYSDPVVLKTMCDKLPLSHRGVVKNIADAALFLASDDASYITGVTLYVDGGLTLVQG